MPQHAAPSVYKIAFFHDGLWPSFWVGDHTFTWSLPLTPNSTDTSVLCLSQLTLIDLIIYGSLEAVNIHAVRWSRALRPVFLINFPESRQVRMTIGHTRVWFLHLQEISWFPINEMESCCHRSEGLSEASGTPFPISSTSSSCSSSVCWYFPSWPWSFLGIGECPTLDVSAWEFFHLWVWHVGSGICH